MQKILYGAAASPFFFFFCIAGAVLQRCESCWFMRTGAVCGSCWLASAHQRNFSRVILKTSCCVLSSSSYFCKSIFKWSGPSARPAPLPSPPASPKVIGFSLLFLVNLHHARKTHRQILCWVAIKVFYCRLQTMVVKRAHSSLTFPWCLEFIAFGLHSIEY